MSSGLGGWGGEARVKQDTEGLILSPQVFIKNTPDTMLGAGNK